MHYQNDYLCTLWRSFCMLTCYLLRLISSCRHQKSQSKETVASPDKVSWPAVKTDPSLWLPLTTPPKQMACLWVSLVCAGILYGQLYEPLYRLQCMHSFGCVQQIIKRVFQGKNSISEHRADAVAIHIPLDRSTMKFKKLSTHYA